MIEEITVSGFRGIYRPPVELNFKRGKSVRSLAVYGSNGTGKSSITDALEWVFEGEIDHLQREGSGPQDYPHREAEEGETFVKLHLQDEDLDPIEVIYDFNTITKPEIDGPLHSLKDSLSVSPILRYRDLTNFVFKTKTEKYRFLADQLGLKELVKVQKDLSSTLRSVRDLEKDFEGQLDQQKTKLEDLIGTDSPSTVDLLDFINDHLSEAGLEAAEGLDEIEAKVKEAKEQIEADPEIQRLADLRTARDKLENLGSALPGPDFGSFLDTLEEYRDRKGEFADLVLHDLYDVGEAAVEYTGDEHRCPLCGQRYEGDLRAHIEERKSYLDELASQRDQVAEEYEEFKDELLTLRQALDVDLPEFDPPPHQGFRDFKRKLSQVREDVVELLSSLGDELEDIPTDADLESAVEDMELTGLEARRSEINKEVDEELTRIEEDREGEDALSPLDRYEQMKRADALHREVGSLASQVDFVETVSTEAGKIKASFDESIEEEMSEEFSEISDDIQSIFNILERDQDEISDAKVCFVEDTERAVRVEAELADSTVSPAYKALSESQLNSIGLAVFLASVVRANDDFPFIVLDDIINSFDAHKRPRVLEVLRSELDQFQFLILTHDRIWMKRVTTEMKTWKKKRFHGWDYGIGPHVSDQVTSLSRAENLLEEDRPHEAGIKLGRYLERVLKALCSRIEAEIEYRPPPPNYSLDTLLEAARIRLQDKLSDDDIGEALQDYEESDWFRNFCAHWKSSEVPLSSAEVGDSLDGWRDIEAKLRCDECGTLVKRIRESGRPDLGCNCGDLVLET